MDHHKHTLTTAQHGAVITMDLLLVALGLCMYLSSRNPEAMVPMFLMTCVPCALVTLVAAHFMKTKLVASNQPEYFEIHEGV